MTQLNYPDDGGLKPQEKPLREAFSGMDLLSRFTQTDAETVRGRRYRTITIPGLYHRSDNLKEEAGHVKLFNCWTIHRYIRQCPDPAWALHRVWNFGVFCVHHVEPDKKATDPAGWSLTWIKFSFKFSFKNACLGITFSITPANNYSCRKEPKRKKK